jgi:hypothetical protein
MECVGKKVRIVSETTPREGQCLYSLTWKLKKSEHQKFKLCFCLDLPLVCRQGVCLFKVLSYKDFYTGPEWKRFWPAELSSLINSGCI